MAENEIRQRVVTTAKKYIGCATNRNAADAAKHTHDNKSVLDGITAAKIQQWNSAEQNVNADWNANSGDAQILNKPTRSGKSNHCGNRGGTQWQ